MTRDQKLSRILMLLTLAFVSVMCDETQITLYDSVAALNIARMFPNKMATLIQGAYRERVTADGQIPRWQVRLKEKGTEVLDESINYLQNTSPLQGLVPNLCLTKIAYDFARAMSIEARLKGERIRIEIEKADEIRPSGVVIESTIGNGKDDVGIVLDFILGDGDPARTHRVFLMNPAYKQIGIGVFNAEDNKIYLIHGFSRGYPCDDASISCDVQKEIGWTDYLVKLGLPNKCTEWTSDSIYLLPEESLFSEEIEKSFDDAYNYRKYGGDGEKDKKGSERENAEEKKIL